MQTAKIKPNEVYAYKRRDGVVVRFYVNAIVTRKQADVTKSKIEGYVVEDRNAKAGSIITVDPNDLLGEISAHEELRKRQEQEAADKRKREEEQKEKALRDRLTLYAFIGEQPPEKAGEYSQMFRVTFGSLDISNTGERRLIDKITALGEVGKSLVRSVDDTRVKSR
jgi:hypothetical protein